MFAEFETYIKERVKLSQEDIALIRSTAIERKLRKKQLLLNEGEICRYKIFVTKGMLRTYRTKNDGSEHIIRFSPENWWSTDLDSYNNQTPSQYNIEALEQSEVVLWTKENFDNLFGAISDLKIFSEKLISKSFETSQQRIFSSISSTSEEKYEEFIEKYPGVMSRVSLQMVASYLGVTRETLTRIRHTRLERQ